MTDHPKDGGPAFPREYMHTGHSGMSLRDWFAGQALAGALASGKLLSPSQALEAETVAEFWARSSYIVADAMLAAREGKG
jgi:hypothetical protein